MIIRKPAVAGQFYKASPLELKAEVHQYLDAVPKSPLCAQMLLVPHAGYIFSGPVAAHAYASINRSVKTVIIIGPSHYAHFDGVSIAGVDAWETPLGQIRLDSRVVAGLRKSALVHSAAAVGDSEHSIEVQLPFIQTVLPQASIVPILAGHADPAAVANLILPFLDDTTLVIASSDFSHYHSDQEARRLDQKSLATIMAQNSDGELDACGALPIQIVMHLAHSLHLSPVLLDARNSCQTAPQLCDASRVVGYAAFAWVAKEVKS